MKRVIIACEQSQEICKAFRNLWGGAIEAFSCDIEPCSGGYPEWHFQECIFKVLKREPKFDLMIAHPPCTYLSRAGARWMYPTAGYISTERYFQAMDAKRFFLQLLNYDIEHIAVENPTPLKIVNLPQHSQAIQPYQFGEPYSKRTLLWLKNLPQLIPTKIITEYVPYLPSNTGGKKRGQKYRAVSISQKDSSKTFPGIAEAIAEQWGKYILEK